MARIGLCLIVKNEAHAILRCLDSIRPLADYALIEDIGSTDGTQELIRDWLVRERIPGFIFDEEWHDSARNRTRALWRLREKDIDYALIIDANDMLVFDDDFDPVAFKGALNADFYNVPLRSDVVTHHRTLLCSNRREFFFRGVVHEFLVAPVGASSAVAEGLYIREGQGDARSGDPDKSRNDAVILEAALLQEVEPFLRSRYTFYLAQSWMDCGETEKALTSYLQCAELKCQNEEFFVSLCRAARLMEQLGHPAHSILGTYLRAWEACPHRAEALHGAARYCRVTGKNRQGYMFAKQGLEIPQPSSGSFVETWIYEYGLLDEFAVTGYWAERYHECLDACERLLSEGKLPADMRERVEKNAGFARGKLLTSREPQDQGQPGIINILRPGAIGDVLATSAITVQLAARHPGAEICYYTKYPQMAKLLAGVGAVFDSDQWDQRKPGIDLIPWGYPSAEGYPERPMRKHLTEYFCDEAHLPPGPPQLKEELEPFEIRSRRWITVQPNTGWSVYKEWSMENWNEIITRIHQAFPEVAIVQIGGSADDPELRGTDYDLRGRTSISQALWLVKHSLLHLGGDSFTNHAAGTFKHPAVILFGSTSPTGSGYDSAINLWAGLACSPCYREDPRLSRQSRGPCINPPGQDYAHPRHACMSSISIDAVWKAIVSVMPLADGAATDGALLDVPFAQALALCANGEPKAHCQNLTSQGGFMTHETSKSFARRAADMRFAARWFVGNGIDIGGGNDSLETLSALFPLIKSVRTWDLSDGDAMNMEGVADASYDFVHSSHCLEHLEDPVVGLKNWIRICHPGGHLILTLPDEDLYEQGVFPSTFNADHRWTFTTGKAESWSPKSVNVIELLREFVREVAILKIELLDSGFRYDAPRHDQTLGPLAESAIEIVLRKRRKNDQ